MKDIKTVRTNIELSEDVWEWVKLEAIRQQLESSEKVTMIAIIREALEDYRQKKERK